MPPEHAEESLLLALPDAPLLSVLCCLADDQRSLFRAARSHSRLYQAAVAALSSITVKGRTVGSVLYQYLARHGQHVTSVAVRDITSQEQVDSILQYLDRHGQHVDSISLKGAMGSTVHLHQLPPFEEGLSSLWLENMHLQLQGYSEAKGAAVPESPDLTHLQLDNCALLGGGEGLEAALAELRGLQHLVLRISDRHLRPGGWHDAVTFPTGVLQSLQQLTRLELSAFSRHSRPSLTLQRADWTSPALQPLQALTQLQDLRVRVEGEESVVSASMLAGAFHLTRLELCWCAFEPGALAGKSQLQHLHLAYCSIPGRAAGEAQLLSLMQHCQQLTHLSLQDSVTAAGDATAPAAAYSALTASSRLQHLDTSCYTLPEGVWQHVFPPGRRLPHLTHLGIGFVRYPSGGYAAAPDGSLLVSCCPGLRHLSMRQLTTSAAALLHLTGLTQVTELWYEDPQSTAGGAQGLYAQAPSDEPVWRQLLRCHLNHSDPAAAQQAATALVAE